MVRRVAAVVLAVGIASMAWGQMSPEEASRRMQELNRRAASQPADAERVELVRENAELRKRVALLQAQLAAATQQIALLDEKLADRRATTRPGGAVAAAIKRHEVVVGMTLDEAMESLGSEASKKRIVQREGGGERWDINLPVRISDSIAPTTFTGYLVDVVQGKIVQVSTYNGHY